MTQTGPSIQRTEGSELTLHRPRARPRTVCPALRARTTDQAQWSCPHRHTGEAQRPGSDLTCRVGPGLEVPPLCPAAAVPPAVVLRLLRHTPQATALPEGCCLPSLSTPQPTAQRTPEAKTPPGSLTESLDVKPAQGQEPQPRRERQGLLTVGRRGAEGAVESGSHGSRSRAGQLDSRPQSLHAQVKRVSPHPISC